MDKSLLKRYVFVLIDNLIAGSQNLMGSAENPIPQHQHYQATPPLPPADCNVMSTKSPMILKSRRGRTSFSQTQLSDLEHAFAATHYPDFQTRKDLSKKLKIPDDRIQVIDCHYNNISNIIISLIDCVIQYL